MTPSDLIEKHTRKAGLRGKIDAMCIQYIVDPTQPGTWLNQVKKCTSCTCPLYPVRRGCNNGENNKIQ